MLNVILTVQLCNYCLSKFSLSFSASYLCFLNIQHQPLTTRTFIAVTSILCYHTSAVISVLPFLISCCLFSFFFFLPSKINSLTSSVPLLPLLPPSSPPPRCEKEDAKPVGLSERVVTRRAATEKAVKSFILVVRQRGVRRNT